MIWLDWVIIGIIVVNVIVGYFQGFGRALVGMIKYPVSVILILFCGPQVGMMLTKPWNLTQTIALSLKDMFTLPVSLNQPMEVTGLSAQLGHGSFPVKSFLTGMDSMVSGLEFPPFFRDLIGSMFGQEQLIGYITKSSPQLAEYPIHNVADLAFYTLASMIAKFIAVAVGAIVIFALVSCISYVLITLLNKVSRDAASFSMGNRVLGAVLKGGICVAAVMLIIEFTTPLLCYFTFDPNQSWVFSTVLNSSFHIRPWLEHAVLNM